MKLSYASAKILQFKYIEFFTEPFNIKGCSQNVRIKWMTTYTKLNSWYLGMFSTVQHLHGELKTYLNAIGDEGTGQTRALITEAT